MNDPLSQTERQLIESEERYRRFLKMSAEGIYRLEFTAPIPAHLEERFQAEMILQTARVSECNDAFARHYGYTHAEEMVRTPLSDIWSGSLEDRITPLIRFVLSGHRLFEFETSEKDREGRTLFFQNNLLGVMEQDHLVCAWGTHRDITERKRAEMALIREKRFSDEIINSLPGIFFMYDDQFRLIRWNKRHEEIMGCPGSELLLKQPLFFFTDQDKEQVTATFMRVAEEGFGETEASLRTSRGEVIPFHFNAARLTLGDKVYYLGTGNDISEKAKARDTQERLEAQLRQAQKLEAIGTLAGGIAHDFNNLLGAIFSCTELAKDDTAGQPRVQELLDNSLLACRRAKDLIQQILTFSRQSKHERKPIHLHPVVKEALKLLRSALPSTIEIVTDISANTPQVLADPSQIHQIVMNLSTNAARAMQDKIGVLRVSLASFVATPEFVLSHPDLQPGTYVELMVSDTGIGMDDATLKRIFEPFYTTNTTGEGTGLGLSVVHGIVKEHEGAVYVYSRQGEGAVFKVFLPALPVLPGATDPATPALFKGRGQRVLFVEDEPMLGKVGEMMLRRLGCQTSVQSNPIAALEAFKRSPADFDLVITDLTMPGMTGIDLAGNILGVRADIPILLTSGFGGAWTQEKLHSLGIRQLVMKPVSLATLSGALQSVFPD